MSQGQLNHIRLNIDHTTTVTHDRPCVWERERLCVMCLQGGLMREIYTANLQLPPNICSPYLCVCPCLPLNDGSCRQLGDVVQCSWIQDHSEEGETEGKWLIEAAVCICRRKHTSGYPTLTEGKYKHTGTLTRTMWQVHQPTNSRKAIQNTYRNLNSYSSIRQETLR